MKKTKAMIALASMLALGGLTGCGNDGPKDVTLKNIAISGLASAYSPGSEIEWNQVSVKLNYSDNTTVSIDKLEFDVETAKLETTEAILYTDGLHDGETTMSGEYQIKVSLKKEDFATKRDVMKVTIEDFTPSKYPLLSFMKPSFINEYEQAIKAPTEDEKKDPAIMETKFVKTDEMFTIGTTNTFKFQPPAIFLNMSTGKTVAASAYKKDVLVQELNAEGEVVKEASPSDYAVKPNGIKFNESAIGKNFKLTELPAGYTTYKDGPEITPVSFSFHVEKGLNIANAKELGLINLVKYTAADFCESNSAWANHLGINPSTGALHENEVSKAFWDSATKSHVSIDEVKLWKEFLINKGVISASDFDTLKSAPAFFLTNKITITPEDIPQEYFITEEECPDANKYAKGGLRDGVALYKMLLDQDVTFNGNYFTVDASNIPLCKSINNNGLTVYTEETTEMFPGHATLFEFDGIKPDNDAFWETQTAYPQVKKGFFKNFNAIGNTKPVKEQSEQKEIDKMMNLTGIIFARSCFSNADFDNIIAKQFLMGVFADKYLGQTKGGLINPAFGTNLRDSKIYDCANAGVFNYNNGNFAIFNSTMKRFGGACVINAGDEAWHHSANTSFDSNCVLENWVSGSELYFIALNATGYITQVQGLSTAMKLGANSPFAREDGLMNLVSLTMEGDGYDKSEQSFYNSNVIFNSDKTPFISNPGVEDFGEDEEKVSNDMLKLFKELGVSEQTAHQYCPVGMTENDELFFINPGDSDRGFYVYSKTTEDSPAYYAISPYKEQLAPYGAEFMPAGSYAPYKYVHDGAFKPVEVDMQTGTPTLLEDRKVDGKYLAMFLPVPNEHGFTTFSMTFVMPERQPA